MAGFGFSAGDFLAGINLVYSVVESLKASTGSRAKFRRLIDRLDSLGEALHAIEMLPCPPGHEPRLLTIQNAVAKCCDDVAAFLMKNERYKNAFSAGASEKWYVGVLQKISWQLYGREDVAEFQDVVHGHTTRIQFLVVAFKM